MEASKPAVKPESATAQRVNSAFFKRLGLTDTPKADDKPPEKVVAKPAAKADDKKVEKPAAKPDPETPPEPSKLVGFDPNAPTPPRAKKGLEMDDIKTIVQESVAGALRGTQKPDPAPVKAELPAKIEKLLPVLDQLESNPEYKGLRAKTEEFYKKGGIEDQYKAQWSKSNPGKKFSRDDEEHDSFYSDNDPRTQIDEDDLENAREEVAIVRAREKIMPELKRELSERDNRMTMEKITPVAKRKSDEIALEALGSLSPEYAELIKTPEKLRGLDKDDPLAEYVLVQAMGQFAPVVESAYGVFSGVVPFDPNNKTHAQLDQLGVELEDLLEKVPNVQNGKKFTTLNNWTKMPEAQRSKHWHIGADDIAEFAKSRVKQTVSDLYKRLGGKGPVTKTSSDEPVKKVDSDTVVIDQNSSPTVVSHSPNPADGKNGSDSKQNGRSFLFNSFGVK